MTDTPHALAGEFPGDRDTIHRLRARDARFAGLAARYHMVDCAIHRADAAAKPVAGGHAEALEKRRLALRGEIAALLATARAA